MPGLAPGIHGAQLVLKAVIRHLDIPRGWPGQGRPWRLRGVRPNI